MLTNTSWKHRIRHISTEIVNKELITLNSAIIKNIKKSTHVHHGHCSRKAIDITTTILFRLNNILIQTKQILKINYLNY